MATHVVRTRAARGTSGDLTVERDPERLAPYLQDAAHVPGGSARGLVAPRTEAEIAALLSREPRVLAIGAQSSLTGGATPRGDLLLSTARLTRVEVTGAHVVVEPGVTLAALDTALSAAGRWFPPAPTYLGATVGGAVATNAAGASTFKYGATRAWVQALTVVLPGGDVLDLERGQVRAHRDGYFELQRPAGTVRVPVPAYRLPAVPKVSAGYFAADGMDLVDLFVGAEGTLGVVSSVTLRTLPARPAIALALVSCPTRGAALRLVAALRDESRRTWRAQASGAPDGAGLDVSAVECLDRRSLALLREDGADRACGVVCPDATALALLATFELDAGATAERGYDDIAGALDPAVPETPLARLCRWLASLDLLDHTEIALPGDATRQAQLLAWREAVPTAVNQRVGRAQRTIDARIEKAAADVIVPFDRVEALLELCDEVARTRGLDCAVWGHVSDGNLHPNVIPAWPAGPASRARPVDAPLAGSDYVARARDALLAIGRGAIALGGAPCAEHGVGRNPIKQQLVREWLGDEAIEAMRRVKRAIDPGATLAAGVLGL